MSDPASIPELEWQEYPAADEGRLPRHQAILDHGILDERGRAVGGMVRIYQYPSGEKARTLGYRPDLAGRFLLTVHATRDGQPYGATPRGTLHDTLAQAKASAWPTLLRQRKAYARKYSQALPQPEAPGF